MRNTPTDEGGNGMRLIDADALLRYIDAGHLRNRHEICFSEFDVATMVDRQPTIEAVPVVRGKWIHGCRNGMGTEYCYCSECSEDALYDKLGFREFSNICPHCGARMDGESE